MKLLNHLSLVSSIAIAGFLCIQAPAIAAQAVSISAVRSTTSNQVIPEAYYYYRGRPYSYRYHGMYFNHRYYRSNRWHYY